MLCSNCSSKEASFHYKYIQNGTKREVHLCLDCARKLGYIKEKENTYNPVSLLGELFSFPHSSHSQMADTLCPSCGTSFDSIRRTGFVGCDKCYDSFGTSVDAILSKIQPSTVHKGRLGGTGGKKIERDNTIKKLREELNRAIMDENYEQAVIIRDKIKEIELKGGEE